MRIFALLLAFAGAALFLNGCSSEATPADIALDSITDPSIADPADYLISAHDTTPSDSLKKVPTVVTFHGFSASTFEWLEFRDYCDSVNDGVRVSLALLGGHGRSYEAFKDATWQVWQSGPLAEYQALVDKGYTNLDISCSSTGCPLVVEAIASGWFKNKVAPKHIIMVDPIVIASTKDLSMIDIVGPVLGDVSTSCTDIEKVHWYCSLPPEALSQLMSLLNRVVSQLQDGVVAPTGTTVVVYKSKHDDSADPVSALLLYKGLTQADKSKIDIRFVNSSVHVFTRGAGRTNWSSAERDLQYQTFAVMDSMFRAN